MVYTNFRDFANTTQNHKTETQQREKKDGFQVCNGWLKEVQSRNIYFMVVTDEVSNEDMFMLSSYCTNVHPKNNLDILD